MAYPPRRLVVSPEAVAAQGRTPGFPTPSAANKVMRPRPAVAEPTPTPRSPPVRLRPRRPLRVDLATAPIRRAASSDPGERIRPTRKPARKVTAPPWPVVAEPTGGCASVTKPSGVAVSSRRRVPRFPRTRLRERHHARDRDAGFGVAVGTASSSTPATSATSLMTIVNDDLEAVTEESFEHLRGEAPFLDKLITLCSNRATATGCAIPNSQLLPCTKPAQARVKDVPSETERFYRLAATG